MDTIIGTVIAALLTLIFFIFGLVLDGAKHHIVGSAERIKNKNESDVSLDTHPHHQEPDMQRFFDSMCQGLTPEAKQQYIDLFEKTHYASKPLKPVVTFDDIKHKLPYIENTKFMRLTHHNGQKKLFTSEVQFLTDAIPVTAEDLKEEGDRFTAVCVYAGSAPSNKTGLLSWLFPKVKFILVDPNKFDIFGTKPAFLRERNSDVPLSLDLARKLIQQAVDHTNPICIINDLFTMDLAFAIAEIIPQVYFISDIRTNMNEGDKTPDSLDILWNLSQQYNWMCVMKPIKSMLKFRHPFYADAPEIFLEKCRQSPYADDFELSRENGIDFIENFNTRNLIYWDGVINIQAFAGNTSTETRLITDGTKLKDYGTPQEYEDRFFYFNGIERGFGRHVNENADQGMGFDYCNDCALENLVWKNYLEKYGSMPRLHGQNVKKLVQKISGVTHRSLFRENHGYLFRPFEPSELYNAVAQYRKDRSVSIVKYLTSARK